MASYLPTSFIGITNADVCLCWETCCTARRTELSSAPPLVQNSTTATLPWAMLARIFAEWSQGCSCDAFGAWCLITTAVAAACLTAAGCLTAGCVVTECLTPGCTGVAGLAVASAVSGFGVTDAVVSAPACSALAASTCDCTTAFCASEIGALNCDLLSAPLPGGFSAT